MRFDFRLQRGLVAKSSGPFDAFRSLIELSRADARKDSSKLRIHSDTTGQLSSSLPLLSYRGMAVLVVDLEPLLNRSLPTFK